MKPLNREWHRLHPMPVRPSREQRVKWHVEHKLVCGCREVPASLKADVEAGLRRAGLQTDAEPAPETASGESNGNES